MSKETTEIKSGRISIQIEKFAFFYLYKVFIDGDSFICSDSLSLEDSTKDSVIRVACNHAKEQLTSMLNNVENIKGLIEH